MRNQREEKFQKSGVNKSRCKNMKKLGEKTNKRRLKTHMNKL